MNIVGRMKIWFAISLLTILIGIGAIAYYGLRPAIDFTGGSLLELSVSQNINKEDIVKSFEENGFESLSITQTGQGSVIIRSKPVDQDKKTTAVAKLKERAGEKTQIQELQFETIGPTVSSDLLKKAILSVVLASIGIVAYIAFAFRKMPDRQLSLRFGLTAIIALVHDLLFTVGLFAIAGSFFGWEVDSLFITALLTVMGFSVHDTIVVFDRLRENLQKHKGETTFQNIVNASIVQTLARSLNTSLTILLTLGALLAIGGETLRPFVFTLFVGIFVGTYSSIFIASPLVVIWQQYIEKKTVKK